MIKFYNIKEIKDSLSLVNMDHWLNDLLVLIDNRLSKKIMVISISGNK